jgi:hypothetical protein
MNVWILKHDHFTEEMGEVKTEVALDRLKSFDWQAELALADEAHSAGRDCCVPTFGLDDDDERTLQICPNGDVASVNYRRRLDEDDPGEHWLEADHVPMDLIDQIVVLHFADDESAILRSLESYEVTADKNPPHH